MEPAELEDRLHESNLLVLDVRPEERYLAGHIPTAVQVSPDALMDGTPPATGKLPSLIRLEALLGKLRLTSTTPVVVYDDEGGGWAGRMIWTLDMVGHTNTAYLNGGLCAWLGAAMPLSQEVPPKRQATTPRLKLHPEYRIELEELQARFREVVVWDARSADEYQGDRKVSARSGHIPGAIHLEWLELIDQNRELRLHQDAAQLLADKGLQADAEIITHCQTHHRSGLTYLAARLLGYQRIRAYDGSWAEWGNQNDTPIATGEAPG